MATIGAYGAAIQANADNTFGEPECPVDATAYVAAKAALDQDQDNEALKLPVEAWKRNSKAFSTLALALPTKLF